MMGWRGMRNPRFASCRSHGQRVDTIPFEDGLGRL